MTAYRIRVPRGVRYGFVHLREGRSLYSCAVFNLTEHVDVAATEARVREQERLLAEEGKAEEDKKRKVGLVVQLLNPCAVQLLNPVITHSLKAPGLNP